MSPLRACCPVGHSWIGRCAVAFFSGLCFFSTPTSFAQTSVTNPSALPYSGYPTKPIHLVVPFAPGGSTDLIARLMGQALEKSWHQSVIVDNRPGASGNVGVDFVAKSAPDGYTLIFGHVGTFGFGPALWKQLPYDPIKDFVAIHEFAMVPNLLVINPHLPAFSVKDLIHLARSQPGQMNYASSGPGSASHLAVENFKLLSHTQITNIAYRGTGPMMTDLIAGLTSLTITGVPPLYPFVQSGKLRALAVGSLKRIALMPQTPTINESGLAGYESTTWFGPLAPAKTPQEIVTKMNTQLNQILTQEVLKKRFASEGVEAVGGSALAFERHIKLEISRWAKVVNEAKITIE